MQIKTYKDYIDDLQNLYPAVDVKDLELIMNYQFRQLYLHNSYGGDTFIQYPDLWMYIGFLKKDSLKYYKYYIKKLARKIRILYKRMKIKWDGYYYFALTEDQYQYYLQQKKPKGRHKTYYKMYRLFLYRIKDECSVREACKKYLFRIKSPYDMGFLKVYRETTLKNPELIEIRNPLKFKDILVSNNNYLNYEEQSN